MEVPCHGANELADAVAPKYGWNPRTVKTLINRLARKQVVGHTKQGRSFLFHPLLEEEACAGAAAESFLERVFGGSLSPMLNFLVQRRKISRKQMAELRKILDDQ
ncbi:MAG: BlaI/MecI/CopY family transcriptional regulator [Pedosphaera parvula]|nr:BlaI/MecI/CopY family transcriptional regulator [Pedosphaera parvula]